MDEILDTLEKKRTSKKIFSNLSFALSLISISFWIIFLLAATTEIRIQNGEYRSTTYHPRFLLPFVLLFCIASLTFTVISFTRRERSNALRWIGGILNLLIAMILVSF